VPFVRQWFVNNKVDHFTIAVWLNRTAVWDYAKAVVFNHDCDDVGAFGIFAYSQVEGGVVTTENDTRYVFDRVNIAPN